MDRHGSMWYAALCICLVSFAVVSFTVVGCKQEPTPPPQVKQAPPPQPPPVKEDPQVLIGFTERVQQYVKLHKEVAASLPRLKPTKDAAKIAERQSALAQKLREARSGAKRGDIFTPEISAQFVLLIRREFRGPEAPAVRKTIREGSPLQDMPLRVGAAYPEALPFTTVPPALLQTLPLLPEEVAYRIVGRDLILYDVGANIIVDFIPEALP